MAQRDRRRRRVEARSLAAVPDDPGAALAAQAFIVAPRSVRQADPELRAGLVAAAARVREAELELRELAAAAHVVGLSWEVVGYCLGITGSGALRMVRRAALGT